MHSARSPSAAAALAPSLHARWCAETVRLYEESTRRLDDSALLPRIRDLAGDDESKLCRRAAELAASAELTPPSLPWQGIARWWWMLLAVLVLGSGMLSAFAVLGRGEQPVNIVWAGLALLGIPSLSLALWLLSLLLPRQAGAGAALGQMLSWLQMRWLGGHRARLWLRALGGLSQRSDWLRWWFAALSHALWAAFLLGACIGLLLALSLRSYGFVWATTILPANVFALLVEGLAWLPAQFGFAVPHRDWVLASGGEPLLLPEVRRAWSSWFVGLLLVYGLLPRLLGVLGCVWMLRRGLRQALLDLSLPYYAQLRQRLSPSSSRIGVVDAQAHPLPEFHLGRHRGLRGTRNIVLGIELPADLNWPPALGTATDEGVIDSREQRHQLLARLQDAPARRALLVVDARQSPDRGSLSLIAEISPRVEDLAIWLSGAASAERIDVWQSALRELGVEPEHIGQQWAPLRAWLDADEARA